MISEALIYFLWGFAVGAIPTILIKSNSVENFGHWATVAAAIVACFALYFSNKSATEQLRQSTLTAQSQITLEQMTKLRELSHKIKTPEFRFEDLILEYQALHKLYLMSFLNKKQWDYFLADMENAILNVDVDCRYWGHFVEARPWDKDFKPTLKYAVVAAKKNCR